MSQEETLEQYFHRFSHDINCLNDQDRNIRKQGLIKINKELLSTPHKEYVQQLLSQSLMNSLLKTLEDPIEKHREMTISLFEKLLEQINFEDKVLLSMLILCIISRLNKIPFAETSEELRLKLVNLFKKILKKYPNEIKPHISELAKMIGVILKDQFPDIKVQVCQLITELTKEMKNDIGSYAKQIIDSLCTNMKHQHNKIRKISITALVDLLLCNEAGNLIDECIPSLTIISNDKNKDTRKIFLTKIAELLEKLNSIYLKKYEGKLFVLLLSGISDDDEDNQKLAKKLIEEVGENIHKLEMELNKKE